jgi:thiamine biosynthesis lipoprotein
LPTTIACQPTAQQPLAFTGFTS